MEVVYYFFGLHIGRVSKACMCFSGMITVPSDSVRRISVSLDFALLSLSGVRYSRPSGTRGGGGVKIHRR